MTHNKQPQPMFRAGDHVVLRIGTYQGTPGVFVRFREDKNWADIKQDDGVVRSHPVAWLGSAGSSLVELVSDRQ